MKPNQVMIDTDLKDSLRADLENGLQQLGLLIPVISKSCSLQSDSLPSERQKNGPMVTAEQKKLLLDYLFLLIKWNKAFNLTSIRDPRQMVVRHLIDSLVIIPWLNKSDRKHFLDVGTGAGIPGLPLSIVFPEKHFTLLDSNGKKTRFLTQVKTELQRQNVEVVKNRIESFRPLAQPDTIFCRAFSSLTDFVTGVEHLMTKDTQLLAMKGVIPDKELKNLPDTVKLESIIQLEVPNLDEERHLIILKSQDATNVSQGE